MAADTFLGRPMDWLRRAPPTAHGARRTAERSSMEHVELVGRVVHEVDAGSVWHNREAKQRTGTWRGARTIEEARGDLIAPGRRLDDPAVVTVDGCTRSRPAHRSPAGDGLDKLQAEERAAKRGRRANRR